MNNLPTISVVIPCYNAASMIEDTIKSVLAQDYPHVELIILDAASTDGTVDIIKRYAPHIAHWRSEPDDGPNAAYNEGIEKANGQIVALLNADDWYEPDTLTQVGQAFADHPHADMVTVAARMVSFDTAGALAVHKQFEGSAQALTMLASPIPNARFITKQVYETHGLFQTLNHRGQRLIAADLELLLRLSNQGLHNIVLAHMGLNYRVHSGSITFSNNPKNNRQMYDERAWIAEEYLSPSPLGAGQGWGLESRLSPLKKEEIKRLKRWHRRATTRLAVYHAGQKDWAKCREQLQRGWRVGRIVWACEMLRIFLISQFKKLDVAD